MHARVYRFDEFRIDPTRHEFWAGEEQVSLQLKVFEVLVYLLENRDRAVCRDELISAVWGRVDVSDNELNVIIGRARQALGDSGEKQHTIRTVPRFGYCWVRRVEEDNVNLTHNGHSEESGKASSIHVKRDAVAVPTGGDHESGPVPSAQPWHKTARWTSPLLVVVAAAAAAAAAFWPARNGEEIPILPPVDQTALVLPVTVIGDDNASWVRLGVMDLIVDRLRNAGQPVLPSDNTVALVQNFDTDAHPELLESLARAAAANMVIQTEAEVVNGHWLVRLRTIYGHDTSLTAQGDAQDILVAAGAASDRMAQMLGYPLPEIAIDAADGESLNRLIQQMKSAELSASYEQVRALFDDATAAHRAHPTVRLLAASADLNSGRYAEAMAALESLLDDVSPDEDPVLHAKAQYTLGWVHLHGYSDYMSAEQFFTDVVDVLEDIENYEGRRVFAKAMAGRGGARSLQGRHLDALPDLSRAAFAMKSTSDRMGLVMLNNNIGGVHKLAGRYDEAIPYFRHAAEAAVLFQAPSWELRAHYNLLTAHLDLLDPMGALAEEARLSELLEQVSSPRFEFSVKLSLCLALAASGRIDEAEELLRQVLQRTEYAELPERTPLARGVAAQIAWAAGNPELAADMAAEALENSWHWLTAERFLFQTYLTGVRALLAIGQVEAAKTMASSAAAWNGVRDDAVIGTLARLIEAELAAGAGDAGAAALAFEQAQRQAEILRVPLLLLEVSQSYSRWLLEQGQSVQAAVIIGRVAGWSDRHFDAALLQLRLHHATGDTSPWRTTLNHVRALAGERPIPPELLVMPNGASNSTGLAAVDHPI